MSAMEVSLDALEQGVLRPISDESPAGVSVRLEASFETLDRLIKSADSLTADTPPDWSVISTQAHNILRQESKDLLVATWWCLATTHQYGPEGLKITLLALLKLVTRYWEFLYPEPRRARARASALEWLMEKLGVWTQLQEFRAEDRPHLEAALIALAKLQEFCQERLAGQEPDITTLIRTLREHEKRLASTTLPVEAAPAAPVVSSQAAQKAPDKPTQPSVVPVAAKLPDTAAALQDEKGIRDYLRQIQSATRALADALVRQDVGDPRAYEINRAMTWAAITQLPDAKDGVTALKSVPLERRQLFRELQDSGRHEALVCELEKSFTNAPFWLDCHYMACQALQALNAQNAVRAVEHMLAGFLERYPELVRYKFADGTGFASDETRQWIETLLSSETEVVANEVTVSSMSERPENSAGTNDTKACSSREQDDDVVVQKAHELARSKAVTKAITLLQEHYRQGRTEAERFHRQLFLAEFCIKHKQSGLAKALLEDLDLRIQNLPVAQWEPGLSVKVMELLLKVGEAGKSRFSGNNLQELYFNRLCLMDAARAAELSR